MPRWRLGAEMRLGAKMEAWNQDGGLVPRWRLGAKMEAWC